MTTANITLSKGQSEFFLSKAKFRGLSAGYGFGKSHLMGLCAVTDAMHSSSAIVGVYEPFHDLIRTVAWPNVQSWLTELGVAYTLNKQDSAIYTSNSGVGDFYFRSMDNVEALVGYQTYSSHIDEIDTMSADNAEKAFFKIMGRNRQNLSDVPIEYQIWNSRLQGYECVNRISVYSTPEGFKFLYKMWHPDQENAKKNLDFKLFYGRTMDNLTLADDYLNNLRNTYPEKLLAAYMEGKFVNLESGSVYYNFDRFLKDTKRQILSNDVLHIGVDFNVQHTCGIVTVVDANSVSVVAEIINQLDTPALIKVIKERWPTHRVVIYPDCSGSQRTSANANTNNIALLRLAGFEIRARSRNPKVANRVTSVVKLFEDKRLYVNVTNCPELTRCLEQQAYNVHGEPDKSNDLDHPLDALGYRIEYSYSIEKPILRLPYSFVSKRS
jgi:hypothetical protein